MIWIIIIFAILTILIATIITIVQTFFAVKEDPIVENINKLLPQTQCGQCGYPGCIPYAEAVAKGEAINKCTPGGQETVIKIAELLNCEVPSEEMAEPEDIVAIIDEDVCIGCLKCIDACPVDAIIGTKSMMHVIIPDYCTGCKLCVDPCPVKCISMVDRKKEVDLFTKIREKTNFPKGVTVNTLLKITNIDDNQKVALKPEKLTLSTITEAIKEDQTVERKSIFYPKVSDKDTSININKLSSTTVQEINNMDDNYSSVLVNRLALKLAQQKNITSDNQKNANDVPN